MSNPPDYYHKHLIALGRLCTIWARLDREINYLIQAMLGITEEQVACLAHELDAVAPRCRFIKNLGYTIDRSNEWREALEYLMNVISNEFGPSRNRFVHDLWVEENEAMVKIDRRVRVGKPGSFEGKRLTFDVKSNVHYDELDRLTIQLWFISAEVVKARFDVEGTTPAGHPPRRDQLLIERVRWVQTMDIPPEA